jgi:MFS family permease
MNSKEKRQSINLSAFERRAAMGLASIFALRMLGLFMIMPIFTLYAMHYQGATPFLIGMALGVYGVTSGLLQAPWGWLSDRYGRKPVIVTGLALFAIGSVVAAMSHSMFWLIVGRLLQGAGAVGSTVLALLADLTRPEVRTRAMAMVGMTIGSSFVLAMILGPMLSGIIGLSGIFALTAILAVIAIIGVLWKAPDAAEVHAHLDQKFVGSDIGRALRNRNLFCLYFGIFVLHAILTATFVHLPLLLTQQMGVALNHQWMIYLPVLILAFVAMVPLVIIAEKRRKMKEVFLVAILLLIASEIFMQLLSDKVWIIGFSLCLFFMAFTTLEALLPSWVSKVAPVQGKGTALGIYSSSQFFGAFVGGAAAGWLLSANLYSDVYMLCIALLGLWFWAATQMSPPSYLSTKMLNISGHHLDENLLRQSLLNIAGVHEVVIDTTEKVAYLKVDSQQVDNEAILRFSQIQAS